MNLLFKIFVNLRRVFEKIGWNLFKVKNWEILPDEMKWEDLKDLSPEIFNKKINTLEYQYDPIRGLFDYSFPVDCPQYFFKQLPQGRDCDDWARIWVCYYLNKKQEIEEWVVTSKKHPFTSSHFVAVVKEDNGYRLLNYERSNKVYSSQEEALAELGTWNNGDYEDSIRLQCLYKKYTLN